MVRSGRNLLDAVNGRSKISSSWHDRDTKYDWDSGSDCCDVVEVLDCHVMRFSSGLPAAASRFAIG